MYLARLEPTTDDVFLQRDPAGFVNTLILTGGPGFPGLPVINTNQTGYALQDPINYIDPSGKNPWAVAAGAYAFFCAFFKCGIADLANPKNLGGTPANKNEDFIVEGLRNDAELKRAGIVLPVVSPPLPPQIDPLAGQPQLRPAPTHCP